MYLSSVTLDVSLDCLAKLMSSLVPFYYIACIINIASLLALKGVPGASVYAASKAGLLGMFRTRFHSLCHPLYMATCTPGRWGICQQHSFVQSHC